MRRGLFASFYLVVQNHYFDKAKTEFYASIFFASFKAAL